MSYPGISPLLVLQFALILSLSKDEGEPASWFDRLTMRLSEQVGRMSYPGTSPLRNGV
jgi:hypothetical protein